LDRFLKEAAKGTYKGHLIAERQDRKEVLAELRTVILLNMVFTDALCH